MKSMKPAPRSALDELPSADDRTERVIAAPRRVKKEKLKASFFLPQPVHQHVSDICHKRNISMQAVFYEALDAWLLGQGEPGVKELERRAGGE